jgi:hypothetical protein
MLVFKVFEKLFVDESAEAVEKCEGQILRLDEGVMGVNQVLVAEGPKHSILYREYL